ncbi:type II toxin-antitoxin system RelE/ParE family toxin [Testudinibacter sp. P27/CKL/0425]
MKLDRKIVWTDKAEMQLLEKAQYILYDSQSLSVSKKFHSEIKELTEKLAYISTAYNDGKFHVYTVKMDTA